MGFLSEWGKTLGQNCPRGLTIRLGRKEIVATLQGRHVAHMRIIFSSRLDAGNLLLAIAFYSRLGEDSILSGAMSSGGH